MPDVNKSPSDLVRYLTSPGLSTTAGTVPLNQYMCLSLGNGGNDTASSLLGQLRWMRDGGNGPTLNDLVGPTRFDVALKGQGRPEDFVKIMNFIIANKNAVGKLKIEVAHRTRTTQNGETVFVKTVDWTGLAKDRYFTTNGDRDALVAMVNDKIFGLDCIGFVANYLIYVNVWNEYQGYNIDQWPSLFSQRITSYDEICSLCILIWPGSHIAIIDRVTDYDETNKICTVDVCQSSSGGPQINECVQLKQSAGRFEIADPGKPTMPVRGTVTIHQKIGLRRIYQNDPSPDYPAASSSWPVSS